MIRVILSGGGPENCGANCGVAIKGLVQVNHVTSVSLSSAFASALPQALQRTHNQHREAEATSASSGREPSILQILHTRNEARLVGVEEIMVIINHVTEGAINEQGSVCHKV